MVPVLLKNLLNGHSLIRVQIYDFLILVKINPKSNIRNPKYFIISKFATVNIYVMKVIYTTLIFLTLAINLQAQKWNVENHHRQLKR